MKFDPILEANIALGFNAEMRRYGEAVEILENLGVKEIKLMTNNPAKVEDLEKAGFEVKQIGHSAEPNEENKDYLRTKASKMNHKLEIRD